MAENKNFATTARPASAPASVRRHVQPPTKTPSNKLHAPRFLPNIVATQNPRTSSLLENYTFYIEHTSDSNSDNSSNSTLSSSTNASTRTSTKNASHQLATSTSTHLPHLTVESIHRAEAALLSCCRLLSPSSSVSPAGRDDVVAGIRSFRGEVDGRAETGNRGGCGYEADDEADGEVDGRAEGSDADETAR